MSLASAVTKLAEAGLGGWKDLSLFLNTYVHALPNSRLTEGLFDTPVTGETNQVEQKQGVIEK
jgi:hypothetical protein